MTRHVMKNIQQLEQIEEGHHQIFEQDSRLHLDGFDDEESGWPEQLNSVCTKLWRRTESNGSKVTKEDMYYKSFRRLAVPAEKASR